jgi:hypothetical protein
MRKGLFMLVAALAVIFSNAAVLCDARAADTDAPNSSRPVAMSGNCQNLWRCGPAGCDWHRVCSRPCPDGYSCAPLYGAYGPYGGVGYWGAYTDSGWGPGR